MSDPRPADEFGTLIKLDVRSDLAVYPWDLPPDVVRMQIVGVGLVKDGAGPGRSSVAILAVTAKGTAVVAETTLKLAMDAVRDLAAAPIVTEVS